MPKSTENTVFVRLVPTPLHKVMRHEIEDLFSQMGPIKKSSWINSQKNESSKGDSSKGYGFVKYVSHDDAVASTEELHNTKIQMEGQEYLLKVELASTQAKQNETRTPKATSSIQKETKVDFSTDDGVLMKKKSRIIVRNLSFYAKESHIRKIMEKNFGEVVDVHLPKVKSNLHVGFCFVTFRNPKDAQKAVDGKSIDIQKRTVSMDWSIPKNLHQHKKQQEQQAKAKREDKLSNVETNDDDTTDETEESQLDEDMEGSDSDSDASSSSEDGEEDSDDDSDSDSEDEVDDASKNEAVKEKRTLFLRNLPFDATRHDIFQLFSKFGFVESIYLVKDKSTGMLKGTAFVTYSKAQFAQRALSRTASSSSDSQDSTFVSQKQAFDDTGAKQSSTILLKGRQIMVNMAVDRETAETFDSKEYNVSSSDRRNMYLQAEARVESTSSDPNANNANTWDDLPAQDQRKRQTALKDKTTKLQSPIFFINPCRLSFRNMAKHVDEAGLQKLIEKATKIGIEKNLVTAKDQISHWRAIGDLSTREILKKVQTIEGQGEELIPVWEEKINIKEYIPSVYIDRDFGPDKKKANAPSRGFGFADFKHHVHALACLRELNNNPAYSSEYAAGGKVAHAMKKKARSGRAKVVKGAGGGDYIGEDGRVRVPRLIVDFAVENKVKAKRQSERRLQQQLNNAKQRLENKEKVDNDKKKKRSRGSIQREKKRQKRESGEEAAEQQAKLMEKAYREQKRKIQAEKKAQMEAIKKNSIKPKKKQKKLDKDDAKFDQIVDEYRSELEPTTTVENSRVAVRQKRWFE